MQNACLEHSNFLTVKGTILNDRVNKDQPLNSNEIGCVSAENRSKLDNNTTRRNPTTSFLTATTLIYAIGAGITAAAGTRLALQWVLDKSLTCSHSNYQTQKDPVLLFFVTTSLSQDWVICAPAAFLRCGSRFSGSLSGIEP